MFSKHKLPWQGFLQQCQFQVKCTKSRNLYIGALSFCCPHTVGWIKRRPLFFWAGVKSPVIENPSKIRKTYQLANWENKKMFHPTKCRDSRKYWGSLFPNIEHNSLIWFSLCSFVKNNLYWITGSLNFYLGKTFYSVIVARGSLRGARALLIFWSNEKKWVCNKRTFKVCVSCFWRCPGIFGSSARLT